MDAPVDAAASSTAANVASTAAVASSIAPAAPAAPAVAAAPAARLEAHLTTALQALYKSALIVEQGVAQPAPSTALDPQLERLMGIAQPAMKHADMTNQNLQRQLSVEQQQRQVRRAIRISSRLVLTPLASLCCVRAAVICSCRVCNPSIMSVASCNSACPNLSSSQCHTRSSSHAAPCVGL